MARLHLSADDEQNITDEIVKAIGRASPLYKVHTLNYSTRGKFYTALSDGNMYALWLGSIVRRGDGITFEPQYYGCRPGTELYNLIDAAMSKGALLKGLRYEKAADNGNC